MDRFVMKMVNGESFYIEKTTVENIKDAGNKKFVFCEAFSTRNSEYGDYIHVNTGNILYITK